MLPRESRKLAQLMLLLAVDPSSTSALRRRIDDTLIALWPICLSDMVNNYATVNHALTH